MIMVCFYNSLCIRRFIFMKSYEYWDNFFGCRILFYVIYVYWVIVCSFVTESLLFKISFLLPYPYCWCQFSMFWHNLWLIWSVTFFLQVTSNLSCTALLYRLNKKLRYNIICMNTLIMKYFIFDLQFHVIISNFMKNYANNSQQ